jgi:hypothetical protein
MTPYLETELRMAVAVARAAGEAAMRHYGEASATAKADASILAALGEAFPADAILSEESADSAARLGASRVWVVDPLDGTREFLSQNGEFSIMIGLAEGGRAQLGVVYLPEGDALYAAGASRGTSSAGAAEAGRQLVADGGLAQPCGAAGRAVVRGAGDHGRGTVRLGGGEVRADRGGFAGRLRASGAVPEGMGHVRARGCGSGGGGSPAVLAAVQQLYRPTWKAPAA